MAAQYVAKTAMSYSANAISLTPPASYKQGDLLLLGIVGRSSIPATPAGWTSIAGTSYTGVYLRVCYKIASSSESAVSIADSGTYTIALMLVFRGCDPVSPIDSSSFGTAKSSSGTAFSITGITTFTPRCLIVYVTGFRDSNKTYDTTNYSGHSNSALTSIKEIHDAHYYSTGTLNGGICVVTAEKSDAGDIGTLTATTDDVTNYSTTIILAIKEIEPTNFLQFFM